MQCTVTTQYVPPCAANCSGHGKCMAKAEPLPVNAPDTAQPNVTSVCVCDPGFSGDLCANQPASITAVAGVSTGAMIGIVAGAVAAVAAIGGGGAYAYTQATGTGSAAPVTNNPLYQAMGSSGTNPIARY